MSERKLGGLLIAAALATAGGGSSEPPQGDVLFEDTFEDDRNGWGIVDHPEFGSATFTDGDYVWTLRGSSGHLLPAVLGEQYERGELDMLDVTVRAEATIDAGDGVIGLFCRESPDTDADFQWYEFVARDGFAAIRRADGEGNLDVLAETDEVSLPAGEPMTIEATCVDDLDANASLTLSLNGTATLDATDDDPLPNGAPGLQAYTYPIHEQMDIRWHDFTVTRPGAALVGTEAETSPAPPTGGSVESSQESPATSSSTWHRVASRGASRSTLCGGHPDRRIGTRTPHTGGQHSARRTSPLIPALRCGLLVESPGLRY